jgi:hypothetical protein
MTNTAKFSESQMQSHSILLAEDVSISDHLQGRIEIRPREQSGPSPELHGEYQARIEGVGVLEPPRAPA